MDFTIPQTKSKFHKIILTELVDKKRVKQLLNYKLLENYTNEHGFTTNEYTQLKKYIKKIKGNKVDIKYTHSKKCNIGRVFAKQGLSLQMFRREIRHYLVYDTYDDLDIVNCYYSILYQLCIKNVKNQNMYKNIKDYVLNREKWLQKIKCDRYKSKALYLMLLHEALLKLGGKSLMNLMLKYH